MKRAKKLTAYYATDRRCYDGAPCTDLSREIKHEASLARRLKSVDATAYCTYFPSEGRFLTSFSPPTGRRNQDITGNFHDNRQDALIDAIEELEARKLAVIAVATTKTGSIK